MDALQTLDTFTMLTSAAEGSVSASSARVYAQTYRAWRTWCEGSGAELFDLSPAVVTAFLISQPTTKATRQRQLAALRLLVLRARDYALIANHPDTARRFEGLHNLLKALKPPMTNASTQERARRALSPKEAQRILDAWDMDTPTHQRNRALVAVLLLTGVRRSEAAALRWDDVDFDNGVLTIRHGKGDKWREVPIAGEFALDALRTWQIGQGSRRTFVFCPIRKGDHLSTDTALTGTDVYRIVQATEQMAGVTFKPHDARRTFITEALATGAPIQVVQAAAGHANGETTLRYAQTVDARRARHELRLRYG